MKLGDIVARIVIDPRKLTEYALNRDNPRGADKAVSLFLNGEPETARLILRDLVNATTGFEELAS